MNFQTVTYYCIQYSRIVFYPLALCILFTSTIVSAKQYELQLIVDASPLKDAKTEALWLAPKSIPSNKNEFFVAQDNGRIYLVKNSKEFSQKPVLNFIQDANNSNFIALTSIAVHPSFTLVNQPGYATFYTAHTSKFDLNKKYNRLVVANADIKFGFETVISAWQYDFDSEHVIADSQREILRIPVDSPKTTIQNLAFDTYQKSWSEEYGLLYFSLKQIEEVKEQPLYSGVIMRIYPMMRGSRNYTVPRINPFINKKEVNDEIVLLGAQNIEDFFWSKKDHKSIFLKHNNSQQYWLSQSSVGKDLRSQSQLNVLWSQATPLPSMLQYQGRNFLELRNKMVFFSQIDSQWQLGSRALGATGDEAPIFEIFEQNEDLSPNSNLNVYQDNKGEIVFFDQDNSRLYTLQNSNSDAIAENTSDAIGSDDASNKLVFYVSLLTGGIVLSIFIYRIMVSRERRIRLLNKRHLLFKYAVSKHKVLLFKPNQKRVFKILSLQDIVRCEILLNDKVIKVIDNQPVNSFNNQIEAEMRILFETEKDENMLEESIRHINIKLTDNNRSYITCLYLRKGKVRVTGTRYDRAIDILVDLCWNTSKQINPNSTEKREMPLVAFSRPGAALLAATPESVTPNPYTQKTVNDSMEQTTNVTTTDSKPAVQSAPQTVMIDALDKLVNLHQQGYLCDQEFDEAKSKLLQNL